MEGVAFAVASDIEARWRPLTAAEVAVANTLLDDAADMIRNRWPDIDTRLEDGSVTYATVIRISVGMVRRAMINGDAEGIETQSQTTGPFSVSNKYANPNGNLYLSADDIRILDGLGFTPHAQMGWLA
jgi:hypothetical protein